MTLSYQNLFTTIGELVLHHSPSGVEQEINKLLLSRFRALGLETWQDRADNIIVKIPGKDKERAITITAHKDEIGAIVKSIDNQGRLQVRALGGSFPWVYGEGVVDILGDKETISGVLCFGSRHVSHESPQQALQKEIPLEWHHAWIETKLTQTELKAAGVRPGSRVGGGESIASNRFASGIISPAIL